MKIPSYIINLKHRTDRYNHVLEEVKKIPLLDCKVIEGIIDETKTCFQSHLKCIKLAKENNLPFVLILEDDVVFSAEGSQVLRQSFEDALS